MFSYQVFSANNGGYHQELSSLNDQKKQLTINTSLASSGPVSGSMYSAGSQGGSSLFNPSPLRKRNNYNSGDSGPIFSHTKPVLKVVHADRSKEIHYNIQAKIDKGFFLSDSDWTCYRRNYFQVSGAFTCSSTGILPTPSNGQPQNFDPEVECCIEVQDRLMPIVGYRMCVSAHVAATEKPIDLVQHTSKRDKGPQMTPNPKVVKAGGSLLQSQIHQLMNSAQNGTMFSQDNTVATFERLQFKTATANNGKRRAAQQYYILKMDLFAIVDDYSGEKSVKIAYASSSPLVVRGRSPGHYHDGERLGSPYSNMMMANAMSAIDPSQYISPHSAHYSQSLYTPNVNLDRLNVPYANFSLSNHQSQQFVLSPTTANFKPEISHDFVNDSGYVTGSLSSANEYSPLSYIPSATFSDRSPLYQEISSVTNHPLHHNQQSQENQFLSHHKKVPQVHEEQYLPSGAIENELFHGYDL